MVPDKEYRFDTLVIHGGQSPADWEGATLPPIFQTASHLHPTAESLSRTFAGETTDQGKVARCIARGLSVLQGDINGEVLDFPDKAFDVVVLSQTLQQVFEPDRLILSMLRVGHKGIVSFPNFSHWRIRAQLLTRGYAPITPQLPYQWYDTPNIRVITLKDFERFSKEVGFEINKSLPVYTKNQEKEGQRVTFLPNLRATYGIFQINR